MDTSAVQNQLLARGISARGLSVACRLPVPRVQAVLDGNDTCPVRDVLAVCDVLGLDCEIVVHDHTCA